MTKTTTTKSTLTRNEILGTELARIRTAKKELAAKFKADLQKVWDDYRAAKKALTAERKTAWEKFDAAKPEKKAAKKPATKAVKKAATKTTAAK